MSTVNEMLSQSKRIMHALKLEHIVVVFDQALYAKACQIRWKHMNRFGNVVLRLGAFHTTCTLLAVIRKRFQDAGLKDLGIEAGIIAEGSIAAALEGRQYHRGVRLHKTVYDAFF